MLRHACRFACALLLVSTGVATAATTYFSFEASPSSYVAAGRTNYFVSPALGWDFRVERFDFNQMRVIVERRSGPFGHEDDSEWYLAFYTPFNQYLNPGVYNGATRWPFNNVDVPGLFVSGNNIVPETLTGNFELLEDLDDGRFAANFTQYDNGDPER